MKQAGKKYSMAVKICLLAFVSHPLAYGQVEFQQLDVLRKAHRQRPLYRVENPLHWAIDGIGYFELSEPGSDRKYYSRTAELIRGPEGHLSTREGYRLSSGSPLQLAPEDKMILLAEDGLLWAGQPDPSKIGFYRMHQVGNILLARFSRPDKLAPLAGKPGFFTATPESGEPEFGRMEGNGFGSVIAAASEEQEALPGPVPDSGCQHPGRQQYKTGNALDAAIDGPGMFMMMNPYSGELMFSRQGRFMIENDRFLGEPVFNSSGVIITHHGYVLVGHPGHPNPPPKVMDGMSYFKPGERFLSLQPEGLIQAEADGKPFAFSWVGLAMFDSLSVLEPVGFSRPSVYRIKAEFADKPGLFKEVFPGEQGSGRLKPGFYEPCKAELTQLHPLAID